MFGESGEGKPPPYNGRWNADAQCTPYKFRTEYVKTKVKI
jgi:hypothetical protein